MQKAKIVIAALLLVSSLTSSSQYYWIYFKDKEGVSFDPYSYFDARTIGKRISQGHPVASLSDYPVSDEYIRGISIYSDSVGYASRWFNAVAVKATPEGLQKIEQLPFVAGWEASSASYPRSYATEDYDTSRINSGRYLMDRQVDILGLDAWRIAGIDGSGIRIAVFDGGFPSWPVNPVFEHLRKDGRILYTWDFTRNKENVDRGISHGTTVLSCIGGIISNRPVGLATCASYMLAITEVRTEPFREEQNWLAAAEWAHRHGADIINSSLGYTQHRYFTEQMDGKTAFVTRAANMAASKGILVVNAAGNEGDGAWKIIGAPADGDSVLAVGGLNPDTDYHTDFSSFGPTADNRMKPNVVAYGHVIAAGTKKLVSTQGTSFASPLMAGFAACAWQTDTLMTNMELFRKIEESGHLFPYYDYAHGYGIPRASRFLPDWINQQAESMISGAMYEEMAYDEFEGYDEPIYEEMTGEEAVQAEAPVEAEGLAEAVEEYAGDDPGFSEEVPDAYTGDAYDEDEPLVSLSLDDEGSVLIMLRPVKKPFYRMKQTDRYLYLHIRDDRGVIRRYFVFSVTGDSDNLVVISNDSDIPPLEFNETACAHFRGTTSCVTFLKPENIHE